MTGALQAQLGLLPAYLAGHVRLTLLTLLLGSVASVTLGLLVCRAPRARGPVLAAAAVIQTIPGLALLAIMVPLLGRIGFLPALVALVLYSMLPILRNTVVGITGVDRDVLEAADGLGMTGGQRLRKVELPLAAPVILAGVLTAAAWTVGMATLATPVGARSLGHFIFSGLQTRNNAAILVGCVAAALLALWLDVLLRGIERGVAARRPVLVIGMLALLLATGAFGLTAGRREPAGDGLAPVRIGAKPFTEQYILASLLAQHLEARTGRHPDVRTNLGSTVAFDALAANQLDVYVDYSGTIWTTVLKHAGLPRDRPLLEALAGELDRLYGVHLVGTLGFENAYCLAMRRDRAASLGIATLGDLRRHARQLVLGADLEFLGREEYADLAAKHGITFGDVRAMDAVLMYGAAARGEVDVITAYTTEGKVAALDLVVLRDDLDAFPPYDAILLLSPKAAATMPDVASALEELVGSLDAERMLRANWSVDEQGRTVEEAAAGLLPRRPASP